MHSFQSAATGIPCTRSLEKVLEKMANDWKGVEFRITEYKETGTFIMGGADEVQVSGSWGCV
jgi:hypothetical protein